MGVRDVIHPTIEIAGFLTDALDKVGRIFRYLSILCSSSIVEPLFMGGDFSICLYWTERLISS